MKRLLIILSVALMLLVTSCSGDNTVSGYVVGKKHTPARTERIVQPIPHPARIRYIPEAWILYVADSTAVRCVHVDKTTYKSAVKGEMIRLRYGKESDQTRRP